LEFFKKLKVLHFIESRITLEEGREKSLCKQFGRETVLKYFKDLQTTDPARSVPKIIFSPYKALDRSMWEVS
jgi:hypothetical protein